MNFNFFKTGRQQTLKLNVFLLYNKAIYVCSEF